jgi:protein-disulfide isomerase
VQAALAGECAHDQNRFWELHNRLYADQVLTRDAFIAHATELEMDVEAFVECLDNAVYQSEIEADYQAGAMVGVGGTPTFFINGRILVGAQPLENFVQYIEAELGALEAS